MKIRLSTDWKDFDITFFKGSVVEVSQVDGEILKAAGHTEMPPGTPSRINPDLYTVGCNPTPFTGETSKTFVETAAKLPDLGQTKKANTRTKK